MLIAEGIHNDLPFVDQKMPDGTVERRYLTALPTPSGHPMMMAPGWGEATGIPVIPRAEWSKHVFNTPHQDVPMLDQDGEGACVGYAATGAAMVLRSRARMGYELLSAQFLYSLINGGRDAGANGADAVSAMIKTGICPASLVPGRPYRPAGINSAAMAAAAAFKLRPDGAVPLNSVEEFVTAVIHRWQVIFDVQAGSRYTTGSDGTVAWLGSFTNHEQQAGEGLRIASDGTAQILGRNSWGTSWGSMGGFCWFTERHIKSSNTTFALKYMAPTPADPNSPPVFA